MKALNVHKIENRKEKQSHWKVHYACVLFRNTLLYSKDHANKNITYTD